MPWKLPRLRFGLRTLLVVVLACAVGLAFWTSPGRWRTYRNQQARQRIDPYELAIAGDGNPRNVPPELVAILGDSRLKHWGYIDQVEVLANEKLLTHGRDQVLSFWDMQSLRRANVLDAKAFALSTDGTRAFVVRIDEQLEVWDTISWKKIASLKTLPSNRYVYLAANGNGSRLAIESVIPHNGRELSVVDVAKNATIWSYSTTIPGAEHTILDRDGRIIAWIEQDSLLVADVDSGKRRLALGPQPTPDGRQDGVGYPVFTPDGERILAIGSGGVVEIDLKSSDPTVVIRRDGGSLNGMKLSAKGDQLMVRMSNRVYEYRLDEGTWRERMEYTFGQGFVHDVSVRRSLMVASHHDGSLTLWNNYQPGHPWRLPQGGLGPDIASLAFDPHGEWLATGCRNGEIVIWNTRRWNIARRWKAHAAKIEYIAASRDGAQLISSSDDGSVVVWDPATGGEVVSFGNFQLATALSISPDGKHLATYKSGPTMPGIWELPAGKEVASSAISWPSDDSVFLGAGSGTLAPLFAPKSDLIAARDRGGNVVFADTRSLKVVSQAKSTGARLAPRAWFPDGQKIVLQEGNQTLHVYDTQTKKTLQTFHLAHGGRHSVAIHPSGQWLAICGWASPVEIWHVASNKLVKSWQIGPVKGTVNQVEFSPDGNYLATVNGNGTAYILSLDGVLVE